MADRPNLSGTIFGALILAVIFGAFGIVTWRTIVAATAAPRLLPQLLVALVGLASALIAATVSVAGLLVKTALDRQTERRAQIDSEHNRLLQLEAEARLKLEAAIRALELLGSQKGEMTASRSQKAGAVFTLSSLGQHDLAITLVRELLPSGDLSPAAAADVMQNIILHAHDATLGSAVAILLDYPSIFVTETGFELPHELIYPTVNTREYIRRWAPIILGNVMTARPKSEWLQWRHRLSVIVGAIAEYWLQEQNSHIKNTAEMVLFAAVNALPELGSIVRPSRIVDLAALRKELVAPTTGTLQALMAAEKIRTWAAANS